MGVGGVKRSPSPYSESPGPLGQREEPAQSLGHSYRTQLQAMLLFLKWVSFGCDTVLGGDSSRDLSEMFTGTSSDQGPAMWLLLGGLGVGHWNSHTSLYLSDFLWFRHPGRFILHCQYFRVLSLQDQVTPCPRAMVLKVWSLYQQHQCCHHLGTC